MADEISVLDEPPVMDEASDKRLSRKDSISLAISIVGTAISILALTISATTAFFAEFYVKTDTSFIIQGDIPNFRPAEGGIVSVSYEPTLVFINNGNRPVAILDTSLWMHVTSSLNTDRRDCDFRKEALGGAYINSPKSFSPVVIDPGKITVIPVSFYRSATSEERYAWMAGENPDLLITNHSQGRKMKIVTCIALHFATTHGKIESIERPVSFTNADTHNENGFSVWEKPSSVFPGTAIPLKSTATDAALKSAMFSKPPTKPDPK